MSHNSEYEMIRLQVYLAHSGIASRRKCEEYISQGRVHVNGRLITQAGSKVSPMDSVTFDGQLVQPEEAKRYIVLHKPPAFLCSSFDRQGRDLAADLVQPHFKERLYNVGRLDYLSEGLLFFTNDGEFAATVSHPSSEIEKEYQIDLFDPISTEVLESFENGVIIDKISYTIKNYKVSNNYRINITLLEGKNREIRILLSSVNIRIRRLVRIRIGPVNLKGLKQSEYRHLTHEEVKWFLGRKKR